MKTARLSTIEQLPCVLYVDMNDQMDELNAYDENRLEDIRRSGACCYWDDIPSHSNPFICGNGPMKGREREFQAWSDGWNQADQEICHGVKTDDVDTKDVADH